MNSETWQREHGVLTAEEPENSLLKSTLSKCYLSALSPWGALKRQRNIHAIAKANIKIWFHREKNISRIVCAQICRIYTRHCWTVIASEKTAWKIRGQSERVPVHFLDLGTFPHVCVLHSHKNFFSKKDQVICY